MSVSKVIVAIASGSLGVLSEAIHSCLDLVSSLLTFFVVRASVRPADGNHPFGHGKLENLSALFEAILLLAAGVYICFEVFMRFNHHHSILHFDWAIGVTVFSILMNLFVYFQNKRVAHREESIALETNAYHFLTDVFSSLLLLVGLGISHWTGWGWVDPVLGLLIAAYIFWIALSQMKKSMDELSDSALPKNEILEIQNILNQHQTKFLNYHEIRTRKGGSTRYVDLHLTVCSEQKVKEAHLVCDLIEEDLHLHFKKEVSANIHIEPCGNHGPNCEHICLYHQKPRTSL